ncbi:hypothetical protein SAMN04489844_1704 [Nocardioides exalbidus]|uniref:DUF4230 domain-containing protein n=1 Tax=Nocardioides exalbidus TaxID=402596 RepID=A0A1H4PVK7_9ACTN|nr:hypothetical protein [Nocardioides exalbidus]SEC11330.1 hypothetical protein SAMN04489844_1704 [Nocardioides exalbidus]
MLKTIKTAVLIAVVLVVGAAGVGVAAKVGLLSPLGISSESKDSQVITAVTRTQEVSLLSLGVQGIKSEKRNSEAFGFSVPGSGETVFIQYEFDAKLGIDGSLVRLTKTSENAYVVSVPDFAFIGYSDPTFEVAVEDNGVMSWTTPDIDKVEMVNEILNSDARQDYLEEQRSTLEEQAKVFYDGLITGIDPEAKTTYEFAGA